MNKRIIIAALAVIMLLALVVRVGLQRDELFFPDSCVYLAMAQNIKAGDFSHSIFAGPALHQPLYPLAVAVLSLAGPTVESAGLIVSLVSGLGLVLVLFFLGRRLAGPGAGLAAALLAAGDPVLAAYASELLTESLFLCLFYLAAWLTLRAGEGWKPLLTTGCGALAAAVFAARFIGLAALPIACFWVALLRLTRPSDRDPARLRQATAAGLLVLVGFGLAISPVMVRNRVVRGEWSLTGFASQASKRVEPGAIENRDGGFDFLGAFADRVDGLRADNAMDLSLSEYTAEFGRAFLETSPLAWLLLALAGLVLLPLARRWAGFFPAVYLGSWLLLPMAVTLAVRSASGMDEITRYLVPVRPALLLLAAAGLAGGIDLLTGLAVRRPGRTRDLAPLLRWVLPLAVVLVLLPLQNGSRLLELRSERSGETGGTSWVDNARDTSAFIREWADAAGIEKPVVVDRKPFSAYYSGSWWKVLRNKWPLELSFRLGRSGADLVVVDSAAVALRLPLLATLVPGEQIPPGLRLVHHRVYPDQKRVLALYETVSWDREDRDGLADIGHRSADEHALAGRRLYAAGEMHRAGLHFRRAIELRPGFAEAWYQLGSVYFHKSLYLIPRQRGQGVFHLAIRCYRQAAKLAPRLAPMARQEVAAIERNLPREQLSIVYNRLGRVYAEDGLLREARSAYSRAAAVDPGNREARDWLRSGSVEPPGQN
jgi:hypothetical protein